MYPRKPRGVLALFSTAFALLVAGAPAVKAQWCYVFSSSSAGITVSANITITSQTLVISSQAGRLINFNYTGNYTETVGGITVSGSGPAVNSSVAYASDLGGAVPHTALIMGSSTQPGSTAVMNGVLWAVSLNGTGDLLPNPMVLRRLCRQFRHGNMTRGAVSRRRETSSPSI